MLEYVPSHEETIRKKALYKVQKAREMTYLRHIYANLKWKDNYK